MGNVLPAFNPVKEEINIDKWIENIEIFEPLYGMDDVAKIYYALSKLTGVAKTWRDSFPAEKRSWAEWKELSYRKPSHVKKVSSKTEKRLKIMDDGQDRTSRDISMRNLQNATKRKCECE